MKKLSLVIAFLFAFGLGLEVYAFADVGPLAGTHSPIAVDGTGSGAAAPVALPPAPVIVAPPADSHALPPPISTTADPLDHVVEDVSRLQQLWRSGAIPSAIIVAVFLTLVVLRNRVPWFADHARATYIAAAIAGLAVLVDCISSGQTPNLGLVIGAVATALGTLMRMPSKDA